MTAWHEDDLFWSAVEPVLFDEDRLASAPGEVEAIIGLLGLAPGARVLDLCCGPGRHAVELARRGHQVTGVDRNPVYLERARVAAEAAGVELELVEQDMRRFARPQGFDAVINMFTSYGYFERDEENLQVAQNIQRSLRPGGVALIESVGKEVVARSFQPRWWSETNGVLLLEERTVCDGWQRMEARWILVRDGQRQDLTLRHRIYSGGELLMVLQQAGFAAVSLYGSLHGAPYDQQAERLVAVARSPAS